MFRDQAGKGLLNITNLGLNYSYNFDVNRKWRLRPGLQVYYYWKNIDYSMLQFGDQILRSGNDGSIIGPSIEMDHLVNMKSVSHLDFSTSLLAYSDQYWVGFTLDHLMYFSKLLSSQENYVPQRYALFGGGKYKLSGRTIKGREESITMLLIFSLRIKSSILTWERTIPWNPCHLEFGTGDYRSFPIIRTLVP